ncbi:hypothetical protein RJT34_33200 [Clitoria ternatea]|uniref:Uncharacterized protein n=1 Tax=Clitoria ternatea TaxID=43366 RepID=A0AAN9EYV5_CLITE
MISLIHNTTQHNTSSPLYVPFFCPYQCALLSFSLVLSSPSDTFPFLTNPILLSTRVLSTVPIKSPFRFPSPSVLNIYFPAYTACTFLFFFHFAIT